MFAKRKSEVLDLTGDNSSNTEPGASKKQKSISFLPDLLDCTSLTDLDSITSRFSQVAESLLHDYILHINGSKYELLEVEFYLRIEGCHEDPFAHATAEQAVPGNWYFHKAPVPSKDATRSVTSSAYRDGSRKGLDLTLGSFLNLPQPTVASRFSPKTDKESGKADEEPPAPPAGGKETEKMPTIRGGVLFRTIRRLSDHKLISGPSLLVDELLRSGKASQIPTLVQDIWQGDRTAFDPNESTSQDGSTKASDQADESPIPTKPARTCTLTLSPRSTPLDKPPTIHTSPRIGLDLSHIGTQPIPTHPRIVFVSRPYRYFTFPKLLTVNGRPHTFFGIYTSQLKGKKDGKFSVLDHMRVSGMNEKLVKKYRDEVEKGMKGGDIKKFVGPNGKGVGSSPIQYLSMLGTLTTFLAKANAGTKIVAVS